MFVVVCYTALFLFVVTDIRSGKNENEFNFFFFQLTNTIQSGEFNIHYHLTEVEYVKERVIMRVFLIELFFKRATILEETLVGNNVFFMFRNNFCQETFLNKNVFY